MPGTKLNNGAIVFVSPDVEQTVAYYQDIFGFKAVTHYENEDKFAALYRDRVEIIAVQAKKGEVTSNTARYGAGYDAYLAPEDTAGVDILYEELKQKGADIFKEPAVTTYGSYEFVVKDIDGRLIGIGSTKENGTFFKGTNIKQQ